MPVTWQGWLTIIVFLAVILGGLVILKDTPRNEFSIETAMYLSLVLIDIAVLLLISYKKGPTPE